MLKPLRRELLNMTDPTLPPDETYKPISGMALVGLFFAVVFAALVLLSVGVGVVKGAPIFYPIWLLVLPIAGFVLCLAARNQIVGPESTRAGLPVARWGLVIALFSGLGYAAYFVTVGMAVSKQANDFVTGEPQPDSGFFTHLMKAAKTPIDLDAAFLLTKPPSARIRLRSADDDLLRTTYDQPTVDGGAGELSRFRRSMLVRMLVRAGDQATFEPLNVREWDYEKGSYKVSRAYRIVTPEAVLDAILQAESAEAETEGRLRQWSLNLNRTHVSASELTPLGKAIDRIQMQSRLFLESEWRAKLKDAKPVVDFDTIDKTDWKRLAADAVDLAPPQKNRFAEHYRAKAKAVFSGGSFDGFTIRDEPGSWPLWGRDGQGRFWIDQPIRMTLGGGVDLPALTAEGHIRLRTKDALDPAAANLPQNPEWVGEQFVISRVRASKGF